MRAPLRDPNNQSDLLAWAREVNRRLQQQQILQSETVAANWMPNGTLLQARGLGGIGGGWRWASPREYDETRGYSVNEVVRVSEVSAEDADEFAPEFRRITGTWVCIKSVSAPPEVDDGVVRVPVWPVPGDEAYAFWELIAPLPVETDVPVTEDGVINCTDYAAIVSMSDPYLKE